MYEEHFESDDDDEEYNDDSDDESCCWQNQDREKVVTGLESRMKDKIISLQDQLVKHFCGDQKLSDMDVIRYSAMADVLKSMLV